jgi:hypothetical protein
VIADGVWRDVHVRIIGNGGGHAPIRIHPVTPGGLPHQGQRLPRRRGQNRDHGTSSIPQHTLGIECSHRQVTGHRRTGCGRTRIPRRCALTGNGAAGAGTEVHHIGRLAPF